MFISHRSLPCVAIAVHVAVYVTFQLAHSVLQNVFQVFAFFLAQYSLLCIWGALGTARWLPRVVVPYVLSVLASTVPLIVRTNITFGSVVVQAFSLAVLMVVVNVPLAIARAHGFRLQRFGEQDLPKGKAFQISLRGMLIVTVIVACLLAFGSSVDDGSYMRGGGLTTSSTFLSHAVMFSGLPTLFLSSALLSVWASLSAGAVLSRMVVATVTLAAGGTFLPYCLHGDTGSFFFWASFPPLLFLITSITLLAFRSAGYRFVRTIPKENNLIAAQDLSPDTEK